MKLLIAKIFRKLSKVFEKLSKDLMNEEKIEYGALKIEQGQQKSLYKTNDGINLWLGGNSSIDQGIIASGRWENETTQLFTQLINQNDTVIDIGANIGYYSTLFSKLVGPKGKVIAFEPTNYYYKLLNENISVNVLNNIEVVKKGLSNISQELEIYIDESSATLHQPFDFYIKEKEKISLTTLDNYIVSLNLDKIDLIKIDVDGHDQFVLDGAMKTIRRYKPLIIIEISHIHYLEAGVTAWDFYEKLKAWGFFIYYEIDRKEILSRNEFLAKCGSFSQSYNIILSLNKITICDFK